MLRWTTNHDIPNIHNELVATKIDKEIWMTHGTPGTHPMLVFDIDSKAFRNVPCQYEQDVPHSFWSLTSHENRIYMWARNEDRDFELYQMATNNLVWSKILTLPSADIGANMSNATIIGDQMFLLNHSEEGNLELITINLTKKTSNKAFIREYYENESNHIMTNNEKLYLIESDGEHCGIFILEYGKAACSIEVEYCGGFTRSNGLLDLFNFATKMWKHMAVEQLRRMVGYYWPVDDKIYVITKEGIQYSIRVLDLNPTLTDSCLFTFVDEIIAVNSNEREERVAELKKKLPLPLRKKLDDLLLWRLREVDRLTID